MAEFAKIAPCLWFNGQAEAAAQFYVSVFPDSAMGSISRYGPGMHFPEGTAIMVEFTLSGQRFQALNGGPDYPFTQAISLSISCVTEAEVDHFWDGLISGGGAESRCGWLTDPYGVSWQVVPQGLGALLSGPDPARNARAVQAMMGMTKLDLPAMRAAADRV